MTLGPLLREHMPQCFKWRNNPEMFRWFRQPTFVNEIMQDNWFDKQATDPRIQMFAYYEKNIFVGVSGFTSIDMLNRSAELSFYIGPEYHGYGFSNRGFTELITHGFKNFGFHSLWAECFDENVVNHVLMKLGMKLDGTRRQAYFKDGRFIDAHILTILENEWNS